MAIVKLNVDKYDKRFVISSEAWSSATLVADWLMENVGSNDFDFIGPYSLINKSVTAMQLGSSLKGAINVLIIDIDNSKCVREFFKEIKKHAHQNVKYTFISIKDENFVSIFDNVSLTLNKQVGEKSMKNQLNYIEESYYQDMPKTLTWDEAKAILFKNGGPVRRLSMNPNHFIGYNQGNTITADKFWVPANKKAAERNGGSMNVAPYYSHCDGKTVSMGWRPTMQDELATDWVLANNHLTLSDLEQTPSGNYRATYLLQPGEINTSGSVLFTLYDMIYKEETSEILIVTGDTLSANVLGNLLSDMKEKLYNKEASVTASTVIDPSKLKQVRSDLVKINYLTPGCDISKKPDIWNQEVFYEELEKTLINNPNLSIIVNLKGIAEDPILLDKVDKEKANDYAVSFVNYLHNRLKKFSEDYPNNWVILDLDEETNKDI